VTGPSRRAAVSDAARALAAGYAVLDHDPVDAAARAALTPTGPRLEELVARIRARRGLPAREAG